MKQPKTLQQAVRHFSDEQVCIDTVASLRWTDGPECPACGHKQHYYLKTQNADTDIYSAISIAAFYSDKQILFAQSYWTPTCLSSIIY